MNERLPELPSDLKSFEADLASLTPGCGSLGRDELLFRAGWEAHAASTDAASVSISHGARAVATATRPRHADKLWPLCTAGLLLVSAALGMTLALRSPEIQVVYVQTPPAHTEVAPERQTAPSKRVNAPSADETTPPADRFGTGGNLATSTRTRPPNRGRDYLSLRERILADGVEALGPATLPASTPAILRDSRLGALMSELRGG